MAFYLIILASSLTGFGIAFYIRRKKQTKEALVCPMNSNCGSVIYSPYSRFLGLPVELIGMLYYAITFLAYALFLFAPSLAAPSAIFLVLLVSMAAFLFSLYLTFIQAFALKQWCTWCLMSATLSTLIFTSAIAGSEFTFLSILTNQAVFFMILHFFAMAIGLGGATFTDVFFFKFLRDLRISEFESSILHTFTQIIWLMLGILVLTGTGLYLPILDSIISYPPFIAKLIIMGVILINGAFLNLLVAPKLVRVSFGEPYGHTDEGLRMIRREAFAMSAISFTSWYLFFLLELIWSFPLSLAALLIGYFAVIAVVVITSQFVERAFSEQQMA